MAAVKSTQFLFPNTDEYRETAQVLGSVVKEREVIVKERIVFELTPGAARDIAHVLYMAQGADATNTATEELLKQLQNALSEV